MEYVLIPRKGDNKIITDYIKDLEKKSLESLVDLYNKEAQLGIVWERQQSLYLKALRQVFLQHFEFSPIALKAYVIGLKGEIELVDGNIIMKPKDC